MWVPCNCTASLHDIVSCGCHVTANRLRAYMILHHVGAANRLLHVTITSSYKCIAPPPGDIGHLQLQAHSDSGMVGSSCQVHEEQAGFSGLLGLPAPSGGCQHQRHHGLLCVQTKPEENGAVQRPYILLPYREAGTPSPFPLAIASELSEEWEGLS